MGQIPWSIKRRGLGPREQACWEKAWVVKPLGPQACFGVSFGSEYPGMATGDEGPLGAQVPGVLSQCFQGQGGLTWDGGSPGRAKALVRA